MFWIISLCSLGSGLEKNLHLVTEILEVRFSPFDGSLAAVETGCSELWCDAVAAAAARPWVRDPGRSGPDWVAQPDWSVELSEIFSWEIHTRWNSWQTGNLNENPLKRCSFNSTITSFLIYCCCWGFFFSFLPWKFDLAAVPLGNVNFLFSN